MTIETETKTAIAPATLTGLSDAVARLGEQTQASVVQVRVAQRGIGSGVIWSVGAPDAEGAADVVIITNAHVVGAARSDTLAIKLADGREITANVAAVDPEHDLASLQAHASGLRAIAIGDSATLRVGEFVLAVGNPFGREGAMTTGVVAAHAPADPDIDLEPTIPDANAAHEANGDAAPTATPSATPEAGRREGREGREGRPWRGPRQGRDRSPFSRIELVQADVRLYPGNSGGPLVDAQGRVIGINAMVGGGLAFAIPSNTVRRFLEDAQATGQRAYLGVQVQTIPLSEAQQRQFALTQEAVTLVMGVEKDSPAEAAGVIPGDILLAVDGLRIQTAEQLLRTLNRASAKQAQPGQPTVRTLQLLRGGERVEITLTPAIRAAA